MIEIVDVGDRCPVCQMARSVLLREQDLDESGEERIAYRSERVKHGPEECSLMQTLQGEEWPVRVVRCP